MTGIDRLIGNEIDAYKHIYQKRLSQFKTGIKIKADYLSSNKDQSNNSYYDLINRFGLLEAFTIKHSNSSDNDRIHFTDTEICRLKKSSKVPFFIFHHEEISLSYKNKEESTLLFKGSILSSFKKNVKPFFDLLEKNKGRGELVLTILSTDDGRKEFEQKYFEFNTSELEAHTKDNFKNFLQSDPSYTECALRLKIFFPELRMPTISKMDDKEVDRTVNNINFKTLGIKTLDAHIFFLENFLKYNVTNSELLRKTHQIDAVLSNYLK